MFCPVNWLVVPGSIGPSPEQNNYVCMPFALFFEMGDECFGI